MSTEAPESQPTNPACNPGNVSAGKRQYKYQTSSKSPGNSAGKRAEKYPTNLGQKKRYNSPKKKDSNKSYPHLPLIRALENLSPIYQSMYGYVAALEHARTGIISSVSRQELIHLHENPQLYERVPLVCYGITYDFFRDRYDTSSDEYDVNAPNKNFYPLSNIKENRMHLEKLETPTTQTCSTSDWDDEIKTLCDDEEEEVRKKQWKCGGKNSSKQLLNKFIKIEQQNYDNAYTSTYKQEPKVTLVSEPIVNIEETKALNILKENNALAIVKDDNIKINNDLMIPEDFSFTTENGNIYNTIQRFEDSLKIFTKIGIAGTAATYIASLVILEKQGSDNISLNAAMIGIATGLLAYFFKPRIPFHMPVISIPEWYYEYTSKTSTQSITEVSVKYLNQSEEDYETTDDNRSAMTRMGKIDHNDAQIWDVSITEKFLKERSYFLNFDYIKSLISGDPKYIVEERTRKGKVSLELIANASALKTLNRDDDIDILRLKMKQSMGNINCVNIPRSFALQNHFIQSNSLDVALLQLRALREGADFQNVH